MIRMRIYIILALMALVCSFGAPAQEAAKKPVADKILFIGDSMTGWLAERLAPTDVRTDLK